MFIVMGATGHIGSVVARALLAAKREVTVITRDASKAAAFAGAKVAQVDVRDTHALREAFKRARRAYLLVPPALPSTDTDREETANVRAILGALDGSGLEYVVAASTYGAQPGEAIGDASVLYGLEQGLKAQSIPNVIVRGAYYFSNFDELVEPAREGALPTMFPPEHRLPMVAPEDLGHVGAELLMQAPSTRLLHVEGPARANFKDVAQAFGKALGRKVEPAVTPRDQWEATFRELGFSPQGARAYARMTGVALDAPELPEAPIRGRTTLQAYVDALVARSAET